MITCGRLVVRKRWHNWKGVAHSIIGPPPHCRLCMYARIIRMYVQYIVYCNTFHRFATCKSCCPWQTQLASFIFNPFDFLYHLWGNACHPVLLLNGALNHEKDFHTLSHNSQSQSQWLCLCFMWFVVRVSCLMRPNEVIWFCMIQPIMRARNDSYSKWDESNIFYILNNWANQLVVL